MRISLARQGLKVLAAALFCAVLLLAVPFTVAASVDVSDVTTRSFRNTGVKEISFSTGNGLIEVLGHSGNNIEVQIMRKARSFSESQAERLLERVQISTSQVSGRVIVEVKLPSFAFLSSTGAEIRALVPSTWQGKLTLKTSNGTIDVAGLQGSGDFHTSNGAVTIDEWRGSLQVSTSNGTIDIGRLRLTGSSNLKTSNGGVNIGLSELAANLSARTSNGAISLTVPATTKMDVTADTSNGSITFNGPSGSNTAKKSYNTSLNGGGPNVEMHSSNGAITVDVLPALKTQGGK